MGDEVWQFVQVVLLPIVGALWFFQFKTWQKASDAGRRLSQHQLYVAENYARLDDVKDVEKRIMDRLKEIMHELRQLRGAGQQKDR